MMITNLLQFYIGLRMGLEVEFVYSDPHMIFVVRGGEVRFVRMWPFTGMIMVHFSISNILYVPTVYHVGKYFCNYNCVQYVFI